MSKRITEHEKQLIIIHLREHKNDREISEILNISQYTVSKVTSNYWRDKMLVKNDE